MDIRRRCMANEFWNVLMPIFKPSISDKDMAAIKAYFATKQSGFKLTLGSGDVF